MTDSKAQRDQARRLWAGSWSGVIGTHSADHPGYPFGSVVPFVLGEDGQPLLLLSPLSQHTRNIERDRRCSLTVTESGTGDVQQLARLTALGEVRRVEAPDDASRYFRYFPQTRAYWHDLGFHFYRFGVDRLHWNGGFATARWFGREGIIQTNPVDAATEQRLVDELNRGDGEKLRHYLHQFGNRELEGKTELLGIDGHGIDLRDGERRVRVELDRPLASTEDALARFTGAA